MQGRNSVKLKREQKLWSDIILGSLWLLVLHLSTRVKKLKLYQMKRERRGRRERQPAPHLSMCKAPYASSRQFLKVSRQKRKEE